MTISIYVSVSPHEVVSDAEGEDLAELILEIARKVEQLTPDELEEVADAYLNVEPTILTAFATAIAEGAARE